MRKLRTAALTLASFLASGVLVAAVGPSSHAQTSGASTIAVNPVLPADVARRTPRTLIITDSTGAAIRWNRTAVPTFEQFSPFDNGGLVDFRGESCRAVSVASCFGREQAAPANVLVELGSLADDQFDELVLMVGYNEGATLLDAAIPRVLDLAKAKGIKHVSWLNFCECSLYVGPSSMGNLPSTYDERNASLVAHAQASNGYLSIIDWASMSQTNSSLTLADRTHLSLSGSVAVANLMTTSVLSIWQSTDETPDPSGSTEEPAQGFFEGIDEPQRLLDTRLGTSRAKGAMRLSASDSIRVPIPVEGAVAAVVNVTAVGPTASGYLTAYPCTATPPVASFANFTAGRDNANTTTVKLDAEGDFCVYTSAATHLIVDLYGTLSSEGSGFTPLSSRRLIDTRASGTFREGVVAVKTDRTSLHGNLTVVDGSIGFAAAWAGTGDGTCPNRPKTSVVNWASSSAVANRIDIGLPNKELCVYTSTPAEVVVDEFGTYEASTEPIVVNSPTRIFDSRTRVGARQAFNLPIPAGSPAAISVNVVTIGTQPGHTTIWSAADCSQPPNTSLANQVAGAPRANSIVLPNNGRICAVASHAVQLIVDLA